MAQAPVRPCKETEVEEIEIYGYEDQDEYNVCGQKIQKKEIDEIDVTFPTDQFFPCSWDENKVCTLSDQKTVKVYEPKPKPPCSANRSPVASPLRSPIVPPLASPLRQNCGPLRSFTQKDTFETDDIDDEHAGHDHEHDVIRTRTIKEKFNSPLNNRNGLRSPLNTGLNRNGLRSPLRNGLNRNSGLRSPLRNGLNSTALRSPLRNGLNSGLNNFASSSFNYNNLM